jgi:hypothetical protein
MANPKEFKALDNPLDVDKQTLKELDIKEDSISPIRKVAFLQGQLEEMESIYWRSRVDVVHATRLMQSDIEALRIKGGQNLVEHKNQVKQFYGGIQMIQKMIDQLREENPELQAEI